MSEYVIGQTRRIYHPSDRNDFLDYEVLRPARKGFVWIRYLDHRRDTETTMAVAAVLRDELVE